MVLKDVGVSHIWKDQTMWHLVMMKEQWWLKYFDILKITQRETTNQCQISYTYGSNIEAIYICYRLGKWLDRATS